MKKLAKVFSALTAMVVVCACLITAAANVFADDLVSGDTTGISNEMFEIKVGQADGSTAGLKYYLYSPVEDENDTTEYPVFIWLHGLGNGGSGDYTALNGCDIKNFATEAYQSYFPEGGCYIVVPQNPEPNGWYGMGWMGADYTGVLNNVVDEVIAENQINTNKIYIGGYSAGGHMTWKAVLDRPDFYAAAVPICPAYAPTTAELETVKDLPIWMISGKQDPMVSFNTNVQAVYDNLVKVTNADVKLTAFDTVKNPDGTTAESQHHAWVPVTWNLTYNDGTLYDPANGTLLDWLAGIEKSDVTIDDGNTDDGTTDDGNTDDGTTDDGTTDDGTTDDGTTDDGTTDDGNTDDGTTDDGNADDGTTDDGTTDDGTTDDGTTDDGTTDDGTTDDGTTDDGTNNDWNNNWGNNDWNNNWWNNSWNNNWWDNSWGGDTDDGTTDDGTTDDGTNNDWNNNWGNNDWNNSWNNNWWNNSWGNSWGNSWTGSWY